MEVAHNNGPSLKEQQLTKGDVSVLVDKCVNFVYTHGKCLEFVCKAVARNLSAGEKRGGG